MLGAVAGIGFIMALFVAQLAFTDAHLLGAAKIGVPVASGAAAVIGMGIGWLLLGKSLAVGATQTANEGESSTEM